MALWMTIAEPTVSATYSVDGLPMVITEDGIELVPSEVIAINVSTIALPAALAIHNADPFAHPDIQAKMMTLVNTQRLVGRYSAGSGGPEEVTLPSGAADGGVMSMTAGGVLQITAITAGTF